MKKLLTTFFLIKFIVSNCENPNLNQSSSGCQIFYILKNEEIIEKNYFDVMFNIDLKQKLNEDEFQLIEYSDFLDISLEKIEFLRIDYGVRIKFSEYEQGQIVKITPKNSEK